MICFPLNNTLYEANSLGAWLGTRTRGVFSADDNFAVLADGDGMSVTLRPGLAWLKRDTFWGTVILQEEPLQLALDPADGVLSRIDTVVLQLDKDANLAHPLIRTGTFSDSPSFAEPVRDSHVDELIVASVLIQPGAVEITQADITDQRLNETYCGLMRDGVTGIPTAALYAQWDAFFAQMQQETIGKQEQAEETFAEWFGRLKELFKEDPAGGLQTQIDNKANVQHTHTKDEVGLWNVDNTADSEKSVHYAETAGAAIDQTARTIAGAAMPKTGGTFTGNVVAYDTNRAGASLRNCVVVNSAGNEVSTNSLRFVRK